MAVVKIKCPECNKKIEVDESWVNNEVECRHCGKTFLLTQYALPNLDDEYRRKARLFITSILIMAIVIILPAIIFIFRNFNSSENSRTNYRKRPLSISRRIRKVSPAIDTRGKQTRNIHRSHRDSHTIANMEDLQKYIRTSQDNPQDIIRTAYSSYTSLTDKDASSVDAPLDELLGKRFNMDLDPAETAISDSKAEAMEKLRIEYSVSPEDYEKEMQTAAEQKYPMPQVGSVIELSSLRNGTIKGSFGGYTSDKLSFYLDGRKYDLVELTRSSAILLDRELNQKERERFVKEKCENYQEKMTKSFQTILNDLMQKKGYIFINSRFYSPSEYLRKLKKDSNIDSSSQKTSKKSYRRKKKRRYSSSYSGSASSTNSSGSKNLSIPSRSSTFTEHIQYYKGRDPYYRDPHKKQVRKTF